MFTGLVETTGTVLSTQRTAGATRVLIEAPDLANRWKQGDSIAVNGVCLTAIPVSEGTGSPTSRFAADLAGETMERTTLGRLQPGSVVNLELPTPAGAPLGGHVVQGHVDGKGTLVAMVAFSPDHATTDWRMTVELPPELAGYVLQQGSITIDGISLTIAKLHSPEPSGAVRLEVAIVPHTYRSTHLRSLPVGSPVNIETDVLAKYAQRGGPAEVSPGNTWLTSGYLLANGY